MKLCTLIFEIAPLAALQKAEAVRYLLKDGFLGIYQFIPLFGQHFEIDSLVQPQHDLCKMLKLTRAVVSC